MTFAQCHNTLDDVFTNFIKRYVNDMSQNYTCFHDKSTDFFLSPDMKLGSKQRSSGAILLRSE